MEEKKNMWDVVQNLIHVVESHGYCLSNTQRAECLEFLEDFTAAMETVAAHEDGNVH